MLVQGGQAPSDWKDFKNAVRRECISQDSVRQSRYKIRVLEQKTSVSAFLNDFRNIVIAIAGISEEEKLDKTCAGLKPQIWLEVLKMG